jgi:hypothetical protein
MSLIKLLQIIDAKLITLGVVDIGKLRDWSQSGDGDITSNYNPSG